MFIPTSRLKTAVVRWDRLVHEAVNIILPTIRSLHRQSLPVSDLLPIFVPIQSDACILLNFRVSSSGKCVTHHSYQPRAIQCTSLTSSSHARFFSILSLKLWSVLLPLSWFLSYWEQYRSDVLSYTDRFPHQIGTLDVPADPTFQSQRGCFPVLSIQEWPSICNNSWSLHPVIFSHTFESTQHATHNFPKKIDAWENWLLSDIQASSSQFQPSLPRKDFFWCHKKHVKCSQQIFWKHPN